MYTNSNGSHTEEGFRISYRMQIELCQSKPSEPTKTKTYQMSEKNYETRSQGTQMAHRKFDTGYAFEINCIKELTILSAARWWPTQGLQTSSGQRGQGEPGVDSG